MPRLRQPGLTQFADLPGDESPALSWPTPNRHLFDKPDKFFARTRVNSEYGLPGWTRDCGKRFHRGCDIAPLNVRPTGLVTTVMFSDCVTGREYASSEPTFIPDDPVFCVMAGRIAEVGAREEDSDFGLFAVVQHEWPEARRAFFSLYAHLSSLEVREGRIVAAGDTLGRMGQTARSADARNWMAIAPHLHFEVWNESGEPYDPALFLKKWLERSAP